MPPKINQDFPIEFPPNLYPAICNLSTNGLMSPSYLSTLIMLAILPAKLIVTKNHPLKKHNGNLANSSFAERSGITLSPKADHYLQNMTTHKLFPLSIDGLETLDAIRLSRPKRKILEYKIYYRGNAEDAMDSELITSRIKAEPKKNHIFWNYPGVGSSASKDSSTEALFKAGYNQAKRLIKKRIPAQNITLNGYSLGGGIATHVARQLHEEGYLVNLEVDRSFSQISAVIPANINKAMINPYTHKKLMTAPLITSTITLAISAAALGTTFAGFIASVGLVTASAVAAISYIGALCIRATAVLLQKIMTLIGEIIAFPFSYFSKPISNSIKSLFNNIGYYLAYPFNFSSFAINKIFSEIVSFTTHAINLIGSIAGGLIAICGLVAGALSGLVLGALLSIQLLWTDKPLTIPMTPAFSAALLSSCCEMDSVSEIKRLLKADNKPNNAAPKQPKITVTNTIDDEVIDVAASLSIGLGLKPEKHSMNVANNLITSFWYSTGGHMGELNERINPAPAPS